MSATDTPDLPDYTPVPASALGPALNDQGYYVGRVERNLYWVTDGTYQSAFLTTTDGVVLLDAPPSTGVPGIPIRRMGEGEPPPPAPVQPATIERYEREQVVVRATAERPGYLVLTDLYLPGCRLLQYRRILDDR